MLCRSWLACSERSYIQVFPQDFLGGDTVPAWSSSRDKSQELRDRSTSLPQSTWQQWYRTLGKECIFFLLFRCPPKINPGSNELVGPSSNEPRERAQHERGQPIMESNRHRGYRDSLRGAQINSSQPGMSVCHQVQILGERCGWHRSCRCKLTQAQPPPRDKRNTWFNNGGRSLSFSRSLSAAEATLCRNCEQNLFPEGCEESSSWDKC